MKTLPPLEKRQALLPIYLAALRTFLQHGAEARLQAARILRLWAQDPGLEIADPASVQGIALLSVLCTPQDDPPLAEPGVRAGAGHSFFAARNDSRQISPAALFFAETILLLEKSQSMEKQLRHLSRQLLIFQEEERHKTSRKLLDTVAQTFTSIHFRLAALQAGPTPSPQALARNIASTQLLIGESVEVIQRFADELRPTALDDLGLIPALQSYLKALLEDTGLRVTLTTFAAIGSAEPVTRTMLYRIAQEALSNVVRHAKATHAGLTITAEAGLIRMEIRDDGQGFKATNALAAERPAGIGLLVMRERAAMAGGTLTIDSAPGHTTVRVEVPSQPLAHAPTFANP
jgi:signal transduction histidine kinase